MKNRRILHTLSEVYNILNDKSPRYLTSLFSNISAIHGHNTRQRELLYVPARRTTKSHYSFMSQAPILYNALPDHVKNCDSMKSFKLQCKKYLLISQMSQD